MAVRAPQLLPSNYRWIAVELTVVYWTAQCTVHKELACGLGDSIIEYIIVSVNADDI